MSATVIDLSAEKTIRAYTRKLERRWPPHVARMAAEIFFVAEHIRAISDVLRDGREQDFSYPTAYPFNDGHDRPDYPCDVEGPAA